MTDPSTHEPTYQSTIKQKTIMHYFEDPRHRIQADMAYRIGKISLQYKAANLPKEENYTDTLHLCLLQNLLTHCSELLESMEREGGETLGLSRALTEKPHWGISASSIKLNSFDEPCTVAKLIQHMRNAMSHPTGMDRNADFPSTGYNSVPDFSGMICGIDFCASPDTNRNRPKEWSSQTAAKKHIDDKHLRGVDISQTERGKYIITQHGHPYARIFLIRLTSAQLVSLVRGLSNLLAQPMTGQWDGRTIIDLIAA
jgi:hypothetical protein